MTTPDQPAGERFHPFYIPPGEEIGTYVIRGALGRGSGQMAYLANAPGDHQVVLKMSLFPKGRKGSGNRLMHERFMSQVGNFIHLRGALGVATIFAHGMFPDQSESGYAYLVQEWIPGSINVLDWYRDKPHKLTAIIGGGITLANACDAMMRRGICHRDLKPENILVTPKGVPIIVDFDSGKNAGATSLTAQAPGGWPGTKLYYSPEVCRAILSNSASLYRIPFEQLYAGDLHALGVIFYQLLTGTYPFDENVAPRTLFEQIAYDMPRRPRARNPEVPFGLDKVTMKLLQKKPKQRYRSGRELVADLQALLKTGEDWARPFQTPARERHGSRPSTSRTSPKGPRLSPAACEGSAALQLAPAAIVLTPPRFLAVRGPRALVRVEPLSGLRVLLRVEPVPPAFMPPPQPAEVVSVEPAPRPAPRRWLAFLAAAVLLLAAMVPALYFGQHAALGSLLERGMMLAGQVKTAVGAVATMALAACTGHTGKVLAGEDWLAQCPAEKRKAVAELDFARYMDMCYGHIEEGPNAIIGVFGRGLEVRDGPVEVVAHVQTTARAEVFLLSGVVKTDSGGAHLHFNKMQLFDGTEPEGGPPAGRTLDICAYASEWGYTDDLIPRAIEPPPSERHPGFVFVRTSQFEIHIAR